MRDTIAQALFEHWQRNVGQSAKLRWAASEPGTAPVVSASLRAVFEGQADVVLALHPTEDSQDATRAFDVLRCWLCREPAVWGVTEHETGDELLTCDHHRTSAFS